MDNVKLRGAMGFAMRAGKVAAGDFAAEKAVRAGKAKLVIMDSTASENTRKKYAAMCENAGITLLLIEDMGHAIGKDGRMVASVNDGGFAKMISDAYASM